MTSEDRVLEDAELRVTESFEQRITEGVITISIIIKYELSGQSDVFERPTFNFDFPQEIYVVLK